MAVTFFEEDRLIDAHTEPWDQSYVTTPLRPGHKFSNNTTFWLKPNQEYGVGLIKVFVSTAPIKQLPPAPHDYEPFAYTNDKPSSAPSKDLFTPNQIWDAFTITVEMRPLGSEDQIVDAATSTRSPSPEIIPAVLDDQRVSSDATLTDRALSNDQMHAVRTNYADDIPDNATGDGMIVMDEYDETSSEQDLGSEEIAYEATGFEEAKPARRCYYLPI